jgi:hypothetical protein
MKSKLFAPTIPSKLNSTSLNCLCFGFSVSFGTLNGTVFILGKYSSEPPGSVNWYVSDKVCVGGELSGLLLFSGVCDFLRSIDSRRSLIG